MTEIVRTKAEIKGPLTEDEIIRLKEHAKKWNGYVFRTDNIDQSVIRPIIEKLYEVSELKKKPYVTTISSPLAMAFAYGAAAAIIEKRNPNTKEKSND